MHPGQILTALIDVHWYSQLAHTVEANRRVIGMDPPSLRVEKRARDSFSPPHFCSRSRFSLRALSRQMRTVSARKLVPRACIIGGCYTTRLESATFPCQRRKSGQLYCCVDTESLPRENRRPFALTRTHACPNDVRYARNANHIAISLMTVLALGPTVCFRKTSSSVGGEEGGREIGCAQFRRANPGAPNFRSGSFRYHPRERNAAVSYFNSQPRKLLIDSLELFL